MLVVSGGCAHQQPVPNLFSAQEQIDRYISTGKYDADCAAVAGEATTYLQKRIKRAGKLAIVLDIDETSLSNWPAYKANGYARITSGGCEVPAGPCNIRVWQGMGKDRPIKSTLDLARIAQREHVAIFFISGRAESLRHATENNLRSSGYEWSDLRLLPDGVKLESISTFKIAERKKITEQGYTIILNMGDQQSDLIGGYAERTYKLPNPVYYLP